DRACSIRQTNSINHLANREMLQSVEKLEDGPVSLEYVFRAERKTGEPSFTEASVRHTTGDVTDARNARAFRLGAFSAASDFHGSCDGSEVAAPAVQGWRAEILFRTGDSLGGIYWNSRDVVRARLSGLWGTRLDLHRAPG